MHLFRPQANFSKGSRLICGRQPTSSVRGCSGRMICIGLGRRPSRPGDSPPSPHGSPTTPSHRPSRHCIRSQACRPPSDRPHLGRRHSTPRSTRSHFLPSRSPTPPQSLSDIARSVSRRCRWLSFRWARRPRTRRRQIWERWRRNSRPICLSLPHHTSTSIPTSKHRLRRTLPSPSLRSHPSCNSGHPSRLRSTRRKLLTSRSRSPRATARNSRLRHHRLCNCPDRIRLRTLSTRQEAISGLLERRSRPLRSRRRTTSPGRPRSDRLVARLTRPPSLRRLARTRTRLSRTNSRCCLCRERRWESSAWARVAQRLARRRERWASAPGLGRWEEETVCWRHDEDRLRRGRRCRTGQEGRMHCTLRWCSSRGTRTETSRSVRRAQSSSPSRPSSPIFCLVL